MIRFRAYIVVSLILLTTTAAAVAALTPYVHEISDWAAWHYVKWQRGGRPPLPANYRPPSVKRGSTSDDQ
jgi:hypothetical protein